MHSNPLSERVIENEGKSFKLWLEFEETSPWDNLEDDFANIAVNTLDGRHYGINVWTFKYLQTAQRDERKEGNEEYVVPPDLFVKSLTRDCIEKAIKKLLNEGDLEELLNTSIFGLDFLAPYWDGMEMDEDAVQSLTKELKLELSENHPLHRESFELIARKTNNDDIVLELEDGRIAVVHLTWKSRAEIDGYPITRIYKDKINFWSKEMKQDVLEFQE